MTTTKKATAKKTASKATSKKATTTASKKKAVTTKKAEPVKVSAPAQPVKVALCTSSYHYFRQWVKDILKDGGVIPSFKKEEVGYNGTISVNASDLVKAKNILDSYTKKNPDVVTMWKF